MTAASVAVKKTLGNGCCTYFAYGANGHPACEQREQTGREPSGRGPSCLHRQAGCDAEGAHNTVSEQTPSWTRYFDWDGRDMLVGVRSTEGGWTENEIRYDGMASRAALVDSTGMTYYAWNGIRVLKTEDGAGALRQRQVHGYASTPSVGDITLMESGGSEYVPVPDQVGTVWKATDEMISDLAEEWRGRARAYRGGEAST